MQRNFHNPHDVSDLPLFGSGATVGRSEAAPPPTPRALEARNKAIASLEQHAGGDFIAAAAAYALELLRTCGPMTGEQITDACKRAGIVPHDDKAFGAAIGQLSRTGKIRRVGEAKREKGHASHGGSLWGLR